MPRARDVVDVYYNGTIKHPDVTTEANVANVLSDHFTLKAPARTTYYFWDLTPLITKLMVDANTELGPTSEIVIEHRTPAQKRGTQVGDRIYEPWTLLAVGDQLKEKFNHPLRIRVSGGWPVVQEFNGVPVVVIGPEEKLVIMVKASSVISIANSRLSFQVGRVVE